MTAALTATPHGLPEPGAGAKGRRPRGSPVSRLPEASATPRPGPGDVTHAALLAAGPAPPWPSRLVSARRAVQRLTRAKRSSR